MLIGTTTYERKQISSEMCVLPNNLGLLWSRTFRPQSQFFLACRSLDSSLDHRVAFPRTLAQAFLKKPALCTTWLPTALETGQVWFCVFPQSSAQSSGMEPLRRVREEKFRCQGRCHTNYFLMGQSLSQLIQQMPSSVRLNSPLQFTNAFILYGHICLHGEI